MEQCCGVTKSGSRCKINTSLTSESYGAHFHMCRFHQEQNAIKNWAGEVFENNRNNAPRPVLNYLLNFYHIAASLPFMKDLPALMLTTHVYRKDKERAIVDPFQERLDSYEELFPDCPKGCECPVCFEDAEVCTPCSHTYCRECLYRWCDKKGTCPMCRSQFVRVLS